MPRHEISDEMVKRAFDAWDATHETEIGADDIRRWLNAALNPSPPPEIFVSRAMEVAGQAHWDERAAQANGMPAISPCTFAGIYRAMESTRREEARAAKPCDDAMAKLDKALGWVDDIRRGPQEGAAYAAGKHWHRRGGDDSGSMPHRRQVDHDRTKETADGWVRTHFIHVRHDDNGPFRISQGRTHRRSSDPPHKRRTSDT